MKDHTRSCTTKSHLGVVSLTAAHARRAPLQWFAPAAPVGQSVCPVCRSCRSRRRRVHAVALARAGLLAGWVGAVTSPALWRFLIGFLRAVRCSPCPCTSRPRVACHFAHPTASSPTRLNIDATAGMGACKLPACLPMHACALPAQLLSVSPPPQPWPTLPHAYSVTHNHCTSLDPRWTPDAATDSIDTHAGLFLLLTPPTHLRRRVYMHPLPVGRRRVGACLPRDGHSPLLGTTGLHPYP